MSDVTVFGKIKKIEGKNYILVERTYKSNKGEYLYDELPCIYWNRLNNNAFEKLNENIQVIVKGRLECNEGKMYIIIEEYLAF